MKTINLYGTLMLFLCVFSFYSCKDDDQIPQFEFTPEPLNQTVWKGNIADPTYNGEVGINFETKETGVTVCWTVSRTLWQTAVRHWAVNAS